jgi:hypothetical protein
LAFVAAVVVLLLLLEAFFAGAMETVDDFLLADGVLLVEVSLDWFLFRGSRCRVDRVLAAGGAFCCSSSLVAGLLDMKWLLEVQGSFYSRNANLFDDFDTGQELVWL